MQLAGETWVLLLTMRGTFGCLKRNGGYLNRSTRAVEKGMSAYAISASVPL